MEQGKITKLFPNYLLYEFPGLSGGRIWKGEHDLLLLKALVKYASILYVQFVTIRTSIFHLSHVTRQLALARLVADSLRIMNFASMLLDLY
jgi:hypothetical protein